MCALEDVDVDSLEFNHSMDVTIISFSGGPPCTTGINYYYQFICIRNSINDTIRVLTPCQFVSPEKQLGKATFNSFNDKTNEVALLVQNMLESGGKHKKNLVVFNKKFASLEKRGYKTVIGTLGF